MSLGEMQTARINQQVILQLFGGKRNLSENSNISKETPYLLPV